MIIDKIKNDLIQIDKINKDIKRLNAGRLTQTEQLAVNKITTQAKSKINLKAFCEIMQNIIL